MNKLYNMFKNRDFHSISLIESFLIGIEEKERKMIRVFLSLTLSWGSVGLGAVSEGSPMALIEGSLDVETGIATSSHLEGEGSSLNSSYLSRWERSNSGYWIMTKS